MNSDAEMKSMSIMELLAMYEMIEDEYASRNAVEDPGLSKASLSGTARLLKALKK